MHFFLFSIILLYMNIWIHNQTIILTGASGGIGKELAKLLVIKYGAKVIGIGRSEEKLQALQTELGENFSYYAMDVSKKANWQNLQADLLEKSVSPVLLINNAGVFPALQRGLDSPSDIAEQTMRTNYFSAVYGVEAISPILKGNGKFLPAIVNISSSAALCVVVGASAYAASKAALKNYTEALQLEEKGKKYIGIVYPGTTATELFRNDENVQGSAMGRIAMPASKMAKKIARRSLRRKKRSVVGWDAKFMSATARLFPVKGPALIRWVMKISKSKAFTNVFTK